MLNKHNFGLKRKDFLCIMSLSEKLPYAYKNEGRLTRLQSLQNFKVWLVGEKDEISSSVIMKRKH